MQHIGKYKLPIAEYCRAITKVPVDLILCQFSCSSVPLFLYFSDECCTV